MAEEYQTSVSELSVAGKSAFTKAILVDYASVFVSHEFDEQLSGKISTKYLTRSTEFDNALHKGLIEVRNNLLAHASYESPGFVANVAKFSNNMTNTHQHKSVSVPIQYFLQHSSMGYISDTCLIEKIALHLEVCKRISYDKAAELVGALGELLLDEAPTIETLDFVEVLNDTNSHAIAKDVTDNLSIESKSLDHLLIGQDKVQFLMSRMRMDRPFTGDYLGNGYRIRFDPGNSEITVSFLAKSAKQQKP